MGTVWGQYGDNVGFQRKGMSSILSLVKGTTIYSLYLLVMSHGKSDTTIRLNYC